MDGNAGIIMIIVGTIAAMAGRHFARDYATKHGFRPRHRRYAVIVGLCFPLFVVANLFILSADIVWWTPLAAIALGLAYTAGTLLIAVVYDAFIGLLIRLVNRPESPP